MESDRVDCRIDSVSNTNSVRGATQAMSGSVNPGSLIVPVMRRFLASTNRSVPACPEKTRRDASGDCRQVLNTGSLSDREPVTFNVNGSSQTKRFVPCANAMPSKGGCDAPGEANAAGMIAKTAADANKATRFITLMVTQARRGCCLPAFRVTLARLSLAGGVTTCVRLG
jgi:hypothetical protein